MTTAVPTVLVVDDEEHLAELYSLWLSEVSDVRTATSAAEALDRMDDDVDIVFLDRRMPDRSGDEVLAEIEAAGYTCRVAMVTAVDPGFDIVEMPFDTYLVKPVNRERLQEAVAQLQALDAYSDVVQRQFALAEKRSQLESRHGAEALTASEEYIELCEELSKVSEASADAIRGMDHETFKAALTDISSGE
jgi:DNA-binding NtrC family response regulator